MLETIIISLVLGAFPLTIICIGVIAYIIKGKDWSKTKKKILFTGISTVMLFPTFVPAGIMAIIPTTNLMFLIVTMITGSSILDSFDWYINLYLFHIPSVLITSLIMRGVAAALFR